MAAKKSMMNDGVDCCTNHRADGGGGGRTSVRSASSRPADGHQGERARGVSHEALPLRRGPTRTPLPKRPRLPFALHAKATGLEPRHCRAITQSMQPSHSRPSPPAGTNPRPARVNSSESAVSGTCTPRQKRSDRSVRLPSVTHALPPHRSRDVVDVVAGAHVVQGLDHLRWLDRGGGRHPALVDLQQRGVRRRTSRLAQECRHPGRPCLPSITMRHRQILSSSFRCWAQPWGTVATTAPRRHHHAPAFRAHTCIMLPEPSTAACSASLPLLGCRDSTFRQSWQLPCPLFRPY